jgi:hypothetical protein
MATFDETGGYVCMIMYIYIYIYMNLRTGMHIQVSRYAWLTPFLHGTIPILAV